MSIDRFTRAYIVAALWSTNDESTPQGGVPLDQNYDESDLAPECLTRMVADCQDFQTANAALLKRAYAHPCYQGTAEYSPVDRAGHDFWLTRNGHGAGYWDRGLGAIGDRLSTVAEVYGDVDLYVGDDGKIYC